MMNRADRRKVRFKAALTLAGMSVAAWAEQQGVSANHVYLVLRGHRQSPRLTKLIDEFTAEHLKKQAA